MADVELPTDDIGEEEGGAKMRNRSLNTQNYVGVGDQSPEDGLNSPSTPTIPATEATAAAADGPPPS